MQGANSLELLLFKGVPSSAEQLYVDGVHRYYDARFRFQGIGNDTLATTSNSRTKSASTKPLARIKVTRESKRIQIISPDEE